MKCHPEVRKEVIEEFNRLRENHPSLDGNVLWKMACELVHSVMVSNNILTL